MPAKRRSSPGTLSIQALFAGVEPVGDEEDEKYGIPDHKPGYCCWPGCPELSGPSYLERELCEPHMGLCMLGEHQHIVVESLTMLPTKREITMWQGMSYAERQKKVKGLPCSSCKTNVPDVRPDSVKVWCWKCTLEGKHRTPERQARLGRIVAERTSIPKQTHGDKGKAEEIIAQAGDGKTSYTFVGGKATNVFTKGKEAKSVAVQDHKGITTYSAGNAVHMRILTARVQRWLRKVEPKTTAGVVALKGPKLAVKIKGGSDE